MGLASYAITPIAGRWSVLHDDEAEGDYVTKEAAFEAAVAAASLAIREGHEVHVSAPRRHAGQSGYDSLILLAMQAKVAAAL